MIKRVGCLPGFEEVATPSQVVPRISIRHVNRGGKQKHTVNRE